MSLPSWGFDVVGTVRLDLDRQPVAGATVRFTEQGSGDLFETRTTASGSYVVSLPDIATPISSSASCAPNHTETQLGAAFPNPFNPLAVIPFHLSHSTQVRLQVYDLLGRRVRRLVAQDLAAGTYRIVWDGTDDRHHAVAAGVYFYRLAAGEFAASQKLTMLGAGRPRRRYRRGSTWRCWGIGIETLTTCSHRPRGYSGDSEITSWAQAAPAHRAARAWRTPDRSIDTCLKRLLLNTLRA